MAAYNYLDYSLKYSIIIIIGNVLELRKTYSVSVVFKIWNISNVCIKCVGWGSPRQIPDSVTCWEDAQDSAQLCSCLLQWKHIKQNQQREKVHGESPEETRYELSKILSRGIKQSVLNFPSSELRQCICCYWKNLSETECTDFY